MRRNGLVLALTFFAAAFVWTVPAAQAQFFMFENPLVGEMAPDFTLSTTEDKQVNLNEYRGGDSAIIFFWATWCPHCRTQLSQLNDVKGEMAQKGIKLVLVDLGETKKQVDAYLKKNNLQYPVFLDKDSKVAEQYNIVGVPTFIFVNKEGKVQAVEHSIPRNYEAILSGKES